MHKRGHVKKLFQLFQDHVFGGDAEWIISAIDDDRRGWNVQVDLRILIAAGVVFAAAMFQLFGTRKAA